jgi:predicted ferric reductase
MGLLFRGIVWFGLYVAFALAPLTVAMLADPIVADRGFALELGVAFGFIAYALISAEFALVSRLRAASEPFGTDSLMQFHRYMGIAALVFVCAHPLAAVPERLELADFNPLQGGLAARAGAIAFWLLLLLVAASLLRGRLRFAYEGWQLMHRLLAVLIALAMLGHVLAVDRYTSVLPVRVVTVVCVAGFLLLLLDYRGLRLLVLARRPWEIAWNRDEGGDTRTLSVRPVGHRGFEFAPGQFAWIATGRSPLTSEQHPMSISSSAERLPDNSLEFSIKAFGDWSRETIPALLPGTRVWIDGPFGAFTLDRAPGQGFVLIAGGIGVTPFRSMLLTMRDRGDRRPVILLYAARDWSRVVFRTELEALAREIDLRLVWVFEEPEPDWQGERGYINAAMLERYLPAPRDHHQYFVCGPIAMMDEIEELLARAGIPRGHIHSERFNVV